MVAAHMGTMVMVRLAKQYVDSPVVKIWSVLLLTHVVANLAILDITVKQLCVGLIARIVESALSQMYVNVLQDMAVLRAMMHTATHLVNMEGTVWLEMFAPVPSVTLDHDVKQWFAIDTVKMAVNVLLQRSASVNQAGMDQLVAQLFAARCASMGERV